MERTFSGISFRNFRCTSRACPNIPENRNNRGRFPFDQKFRIFRVGERMEQTFSGVSFRNFGCTSRGWPKIPENRINQKILFHSSHGIPEISFRNFLLNGKRPICYPLHCYVTRAIYIFIRICMGKITIVSVTYENVVI